MAVRLLGLYPSKLAFVAFKIKINFLFYHLFINKFRNLKYPKNQYKRLLAQKNRKNGTVTR